MERHPIEQIMTTTMENIRDMIDVNTVVGDAISSADGSTIIPISKVSFGFVAGGGEYTCGRAAISELPFAGGTGAGVTVQPLGFLVTGKDQVRLMPAQPYAPVDRVIELVPQVLSEIKNAVSQCGKDRKMSQTNINPQET